MGWTRDYIKGKLPISGGGGNNFQVNRETLQADPKHVRGKLAVVIALLVKRNLSPLTGPATAKHAARGLSEAAPR